MWPPDQAESSNTRLVAMGLIVAGDKAVFVDIATHIAKQWQLAKEANILLAQCGVPIFLCYAELQTVYSMFNDEPVRKDVQELEKEVQEVKNEVQEVKNEVQELESKMDTGLSEVKNEVRDLKASMRELAEDMRQGFEVQLSSSLLKTEDSKIPSLFTEAGKLAYDEMRKVMPQKKLTRNEGSADKTEENEEAVEASGGSQMYGSLPPITMLLKPKKKSRIGMKKRQKERSDLAAEEHAEQCRARLEQSLSRLKGHAGRAQLPFNTSILWHENNFLDPSAARESLLVREKSASFREWREDAVRQFAEQERKKFSKFEDEAPELSHPCMESPRLLTEEAAEKLLGQGRELVLKLSKRYNEGHKQLMEKEKALEACKNENADVKAVAATKIEGGEVDGRRERVQKKLDETLRSIKLVQYENSRYEHLANRLTKFSKEDKEELAKLEKSVKKHNMDLMALKLKLRDEVPRVEKELKTNELKELKLMIHTMRVRYEEELEERRSLARHTNELKSNVVNAEKSYKEMEKKLEKMYDQNVQSPRRVELQRKIKLYEETFDMMICKLGDTDIDRLVSLFVGLRGVRQTWEETETAQSLYGHGTSSKEGELERKLRSVTSSYDKCVEHEQRLRVKLEDYHKKIGFLRQRLMHELYRFRSFRVHFLDPTAHDDLDHEILEIMAQWRDVLIFVHAMCEERKDMVRSLLVEEANGEDSRSVSAEPSTMEDDLTSVLREVNFTVECLLYTVEAAAGEEEEEEAPDLETLMSMYESMVPSVESMQMDVKTAVELEDRLRRISELCSGRDEQEEKLEKPRLLSSDQTRYLWLKAKRGVLEMKDRLLHRLKSVSRHVQDAADVPAPPVNTNGRPAALPVHFGEKEKEKEKEKESQRKKKDKAASAEDGYMVELDQEEEVYLSEALASPLEDSLESIEAGRKHKTLSGVPLVGLIPEKLVADTLKSVMWPSSSHQRRVTIPKRVMRKDRRLGLDLGMAREDSDSEFSSGSQQSFDYDEVLEELEDVYADRNSIKKKSTRAGDRKTAKKK
ncbi:hypothetical protein GUITHDRAFT_103285 [Guillardia theta CCMP2712]|uniref:Uncharacterized protein n=1 Tax=Guillardia theta (strain CCMP2712) TaxID=905079 RepID=L1JRH3_GUITC|nr:hypothetical protein GUITHDRAFT_103285 [Guillardia theta CCMP2712]EKX50693.1 hypothetical protein GUITHDRAFT_103285 [Guillardia theta CCMP2712]|eukprot:XP_005837673.1 hypothetical protein GUITHDRAFT_103285 [Guillardia theta CCMP2712]